MERILLCGNGININFNKKFVLSEFINLLLNENELRNFAVQSADFSINTYNISGFFNNNPNSKNNLDDFIFIINKYKIEINKAKEQLFNNGVEAVFLKLFKSIEKYMRWEENESVYQDFENTFKKLFFSYIVKLQNHQQYQFILNGYNKFISELKLYEKIITLNYDTILEDILKIDKHNIVHWHGVIKKDRNGKIDFSDCLLDTFRNPKSKQSFKQISLFKDYQQYKNSFELDIIGLNPMNDENVFALFINSEVCKTINFFYFTESDILNLEKVLEIIQYLDLEIDKNIRLIRRKTAKFIIDKSTDKNYTLRFIDDKKIVNNNIEIHLYHSDIFWNGSKNNCSNSSMNLNTSILLNN